MSQIPACVNCNGNDFFIESGYYFCSECQVQSQDVKEVVHEIAAESGFGRKTVVPKDRKSQPAEASTGEITSWEILNHVFVGLIEELIQLGCDFKVKVVALQMWAAYLHHHEVAFTSLLAPKRPRLAYTFKSRDAELIYGLSAVDSFSYKNPFSSKGSAKSGSSSRTSASSGSRRLKSVGLMKVAKEEYAESNTSDSNISVVSLENLVPTKSPTRVHRLRWTTHARKVFNRLFNETESKECTDLKSLSKKLKKRERSKHQHVTVSRVLGITLLALLVENSSISFSDIIRWSQEGCLSLYNLSKFLPLTVKVTSDNKALLVKEFYSWKNLSSELYSIASALGIKDIKINLLPFCSKFLRELSLPDQILSVIKALLIILKPNLKLTHRSNFEGKAMALIIFVLKLMFSLDGLTEKYISNAARTINKKTGKKLFVWEDWCHSLECKNAVLSAMHVPRRQCHFPSSVVGGIDPFISLWNKTHLKENLSIKRNLTINRAVADPLDRLLKPLTKEGSVLPNGSGWSLKSCSKKLSGYNLPKLALAEFATDEVVIYFDHSRLRELADLSEVRLKHRVKPGTVFVPEFKNRPGKPSSKSKNKVITVSFCNKQQKLNSSPEISTKILSSSNLAQRVLPVIYQKISSKCPILYLPWSKYRICHGDFYVCAIDDFDNFAKENLSYSLYWLLKNCSMIAKLSNRDIYYELVTFERIYIRSTSRLGHKPAL